MSKAAETMSISGKNQAGHLRASNFQVEISEGQKKPDIFIPAKSRWDFQASLPFTLSQNHKGWTILNLSQNQHKNTYRFLVLFISAGHDNPSGQAVSTTLRK